jgi:hypothetical protein
MRLFRQGRRHARASLVMLAATGIGCAEAIAPSVEIVLSEPSVDFRAVRGTTTPVSKTISVENGGDGRLGPVSCPANPAAWLACSVANGNRITLTANPTGLTASPAAVAVPITAESASDRSQSVTVNLIIDQPVLTLSASTVNFTASETGSGTTPASATVTVTNTGAGTLANLGAISCVPTPATVRVSCAVNQTNGVLTFTANPSGVAPGTYVFPVVVSAPNDNVPKTVAVTLAVSAVPRMSLSQQALVFQMIRGSATPAAQTVTVSNTGGGSLGTVTCPANPASWLTCAVSGGGTTLTFAVNPAGLTASPAGVTVPISATGATNSPQSVSVNFTIRQPVLSVSAASVAFTAVAGGTTTTPGSATVTVTNTGEGTLANLGTITCTPPASSPVTCAVDQTTGDLTITVNPTGIVGTKLYALDVSAPNSIVSRTVTVSLTAATGIALSPNELNFQAIRGSTTDIVRKVKVNNVGSGTLGTITCPVNPAAWLTCAVMTGDTLVITAKPTGLTVSPAQVLVPVAAANAFNNPQTLTVNFTILQPTLALSQSVLNLTVAAGGTTAPATVNVTNTGAGTLADLGTIACAASDPRVTCAINQGTGVLTVTVNTAAAPALAAGKYVFTLNVTSANMGNGAQTVAIVLTVT